tara:strand:- start:277 stop:873 length:597 start_codon:yes stop_codon:yes gene_type:complete
MFLKNEKVFCNLLLVVFLLFSCGGALSNSSKHEVLNHLNSLKYFSASFLQNDGKNLSEGKVYIGKKRVRAEYFSPTKILIVLDKDKAMYYDYELDEDEFFNPKNTNAWFFYDIFRNPIFFEDGLFKVKNNELILEKTGIDKDNNNFNIRVYFENNPLVLRAVEVFINEEFLRMSIYDHNYNEEFDKDFFKLINPKFLN